MSKINKFKDMCSKLTNKDSSVEFAPTEMVHTEMVHTKMVKTEMVHTKIERTAKR